MGLADLIYYSPTHAGETAGTGRFPILRERIEAGLYGFPGGYDPDVGGPEPEPLPDLPLPGGDGGYGYTQSWGSTREAAEYEAIQVGIQREYDEKQRELDRALERGEGAAARKLQKDLAKMRQDFDEIEAEKNREFQRWQAKEQLKAERQRIFSEMRGKDPVRAALFAMGLGGELLPGGERFEDLPAMKGAKKYAGRTQEALRGLLGERGRSIEIGEYGVTGLAPAIKSATSYQRAGVGGKTILGSAYGVGAIEGKGRPGISPEEYAVLIESVTPKGALGY